MQGDNGNRAATAACVDAETLAAWADGGLPKAEAAALEVHLADCDRCTAMAATFARTIPDAPAAESLWTRWNLRWLVPVATAATVAALWVLVPRPDEPQMTSLGRAVSDAPVPGESERASSTPADAKKEDSTTNATAPAPAAAPARRDESSEPQQFADTRRQSRESADANARLRQQQLNEEAAAPPSLKREADRAESKVADAQAGQFSPAPFSANPPASPPAESEKPATRAAAAPPPSAAPTQSTPPPPSAAPSAPAPPAAARGSTTLGGQAAARAFGSAERTATLLEIVSPTPATRWRVVGTGQVQRSTDGGASWQTATLPESATVTGGSSPSPSVCWLVGRTGAIYVTADGLRFTRVPFPDRTDFVSIEATDARRATVVTIDGRTMRTEDQGASWIRIAPRR